MKRIISFFLVVSMLVFCSALAELPAVGGQLNVSGTGTIYIEADRVKASLGITLTGKDLAELQKDANSRISGICDALINAGLEEEGISTNYIYISPRYNYSGETEEMVGYTVNSSLTLITKNIDSIGEYIDVAFEAGANTFDSISFSISDDSQARQKALELAVQDAQQKAGVIAAAAGKELGNIVRIEEGEGGSYSYYNSVNGIMMEASDSASAGSTTIRAAHIEVTANVAISYDLVG